MAGETIKDRFKSGLEDGLKEGLCSIMHSHDLPTLNRDNYEFNPNGQYKMGRIASIGGIYTSFFLTVGVISASLAYGTMELLRFVNSK